MLYQHILKPLLFKKDAEEAHEFAIKWASRTNNSLLLQKLVQTFFDGNNPELAQEFFGLTFPNPVGLAAGFDKNGVTPKAMQALGFGFIEIGSITAEASSGNPKPRAFRLPQDQSLINRMGLNNEGAGVVIERLKKTNLKIPLGINIAKTNDMSIHGDAAIEDYVYSYNKALEVADYVTVNISCPNTGEGKTFEDPDALNALLVALKPSENGTPTLVKFSVDTDKKTLQKLVEICEEKSIDGYVATNTSSKRENLQTSASVLKEIGNGGLSGSAIKNKSTQVIKWLFEVLKGSKPIIGVGGIDSAEAALSKMEAGANLLQVYSGLVYKGPKLVKQIKSGLISQP